MHVWQSTPIAIIQLNNVFFNVFILINLFSCKGIKTNIFVITLEFQFSYESFLIIENLNSYQPCPLDDILYVIDLMIGALLLTSHIRVGHLSYVISILDNYAPTKERLHYNSKDITSKLINLHVVFFSRLTWLTIRFGSNPYFRSGSSCIQIPVPYTI